MLLTAGLRLNRVWKFSATGWRRMKRLMLQLIMRVNFCCNDLRRLPKLMAYSPLRKGDRDYCDECKCRQTKQGILRRQSGWPESGRRYEEGAQREDERRYPLPQLAPEGCFDQIAWGKTGIPDFVSLSQQDEQSWD